MGELDPHVKAGKAQGSVVDRGTGLVMDRDTRCMVSRSEETVIDLLDPVTGRTVYGKKLPGELKLEYPDIEELALGEFVDWKQARQRTEIGWELVTEERFLDMLNVLPPAATSADMRAFLVGEPADHEAGTGLPRYDAFVQRVGSEAGFYASNRPMTQVEFGRLFATRGPG